jgi:hypothetical protein
MVGSVREARLGRVGRDHFEELLLPRRGANTGEEFLFGARRQ